MPRFLGKKSRWLWWDIAAVIVLIVVVLLVLALTGTVHIFGSAGGAGSA